MKSVASPCWDTRIVAARGLALFLAVPAAAGCGDSNPGATQPAGGTAADAATDTNPGTTTAQDTAPDILASSDDGTVVQPKPCPGPCLASDECHQASCDPGTGQCVVSARPDGSACEDGIVCTADDTCMQGVCKAGKLGGPCGCLSDVDCAAKDDGKVCNGTLYCDKSTVAWGCKPNPGSVFACPPAAEPCKVGKCFEPGEPGGKLDQAVCGVGPLPDDTACEDGVATTVGDVCAKGVCAAGTKVALCSADADCVKYEDGDACNGTLFCNKAKKECQLNPKTVVVCPTADDTVCKKAVCQPKDGSCKTTAVNDGGACDDGNTCTKGEACKAGQCSATIASDVCGCKADADCKDYEDGDLCNGTLFCNLQSAKCQLNPATVVQCKAGLNTQCTEQACQKSTGLCAAVNLPDGITCDADGTACTPKDVCKTGTCKADQNTCQCQSDGDCAPHNDNDLCNGGLFCDKATNKCIVNPKTVVTCSPAVDTGCAANTCLPASGLCQMLPTNKLGKCDDGDASTINDACDLSGNCLGTSLTGKCAGGVVLDCGDGNPCTDDLCHPLAGCINKANSGACSDDDACTAGDGCFNGYCKAGPALKCDDFNPCSTDVCDAKLGCLHKDNLLPCSDGTACSNGDLCKLGACVPGPPLVCDDGSSCTVDSCNPATGCINLPVEGTCTDGDACTDGDVCFKGACKPGFALDCDDNNPCTKDKCDHKTGCAPVLLQSPCDDSNECTAPDLCDNGKCVAGAKVNCDDFNPCTDDLCSPVTGCQHKPNGSACNDGNACTQGEFCTGGACGGAQPVSCGDFNPCTDDGCNPAKGCAYLDNQSPCDDKNACTLGDVCKQGTCTGGKQAPCDDLNGCTADSCSPATGGCVHLPIDATCDDEQQCTGAGKCKGGQCTPGAKLPCNDNNLCTDDACDESTGVCASTPNAAQCNDGNACTIADQCANGKCTPKGTNTCNDGNPCSTDACDAKTGLCSHLTEVGCGSAPCAKDADCSSGLCNPATNACQQCGKSADCGDPKLVCMAGMCTLGDSCASSIACKAKGQVCNPDGGYCVACLTAADCPSEHLCLANSCLPKVACAADKDCPAVCASELGACVECNVNADCLNGGACGVDHACRPPVCSGAACTTSAWFACLPDGSGYGAPKPCDDGDACTDDACDPKGCVHNQNTAPCDDDNSCTLTDVCEKGICKGFGGKNCDDKDPCTKDACDGANGSCSHTPITGACDDGKPCTAKENCATGKCVSTTPTVCNDGNACTDDGCDPVVGCAFVANTAACDAKTCTWGDVCKVGQCVAGAKGRLFSATGAVSLSATAYTTYGRAVAVFANGDVAAVGDATSNGGDAAMVRFASDGKSFTQHVGANPANLVVLRSAVVAADQSVVAAGYTDSGNSNPAVYLLRVNTAMAAVDSATISVGASSQAYSIQQDTDGGYVIGVTSQYGASNDDHSALLLKVSAGLDKVNQAWVYSSSATEFARDIAPHPKGGYMAAGHTTESASGQPDGFLIRIHTNWSTGACFKYGGAAADYFTAIAALPGNQFAAIGYTSSYGAGFADGWLVIADENGKQIRHVTFGTFGNEYLNSVAVVPGGLALVGYASNSGTQGNDGWLVRTDGLGNKMFERSYSGVKSDVLLAGRPTPEGGLALAGYSDSAGGSNQAWVLRTDAWGNVSCGQSGACAGVAFLSCSDNNPCTTDYCSAASGCAHGNLPNGAMCGTGKTCTAGVCGP